MKIYKLDQHFGKSSENKLQKANDKTIDGAIACLETFYYAFNNRDIKTFRKLWLDDDLVQLNNPLGGIINGIDKIVELYQAIFKGKSNVWVDFNSIVVFEGQNAITFAGRETGAFTKEKESLALQIRTTRMLAYSEKEGQWFLIHHHGSIDNAELLDAYQKAVKS